MIDETLAGKRDYYDYLHTIITSRSQFYQPYRASNIVDSSSCELIAYYLPQFHPVALNEAAWGPGFTELTQITKTQPYFYGHYQPHLLADLSFYDLRLVETLRAQAALARNYGASGFCFYYYWFSGQRFMDGPLEMLWRNKEPIISIYRQNLMKDRSAIDYWRQACRDAGVGEILIMSVPGYGTADDAGLDGVLQFPPSGNTGVPSQRGR